MENERKLQEYAYDDYKIVTNFGTYEDAVNFAQQNNGELVEVGFTDGSDNPMPNNDAHLMDIKKPFRVGLDPEYKVLYSEDEGFQEMAEQVQDVLKEKENDIAPEDWMSDQNIAPGDRLIILKDGEINTVTTRERIKFLMRGNVYELGVKVQNPEIENLTAPTN